MIILLGVWTLATVFEWLFLTHLPGNSRKRQIGAAAVLVATVVSTTLLLVLSWHIWIVAWMLGTYRVINIMRAEQYRLPAPELRRLVPMSSYWLVGLQLLAAGISWLTVESWRTAIFIILGVFELVVAFALVNYTSRAWRWTHLPRKIKPEADNKLPTLSVLIPARNETDDLEACIESLISSDYPKLEIIVLDDCSVTKRTPEIIRQYAHDGVRFVAGDIPDETNWLAKNFAYERLREEASGDLLLFCGVDTRFDRHTLRLLVESMHTMNKQMLSVMPLRTPEAQANAALIQPMRYFWELALPRRIFKRPPVLSTCWIIKASELDRLGGFKAVARKIVPEAYFARQLTISNSYAFVRSNYQLGLASNKSATEQQATAIRTRYPQLHRRLELVALVTVAELVAFVGPVVGMIGAWFMADRWLVFGLSLASFLLLVRVYYYVAVRPKLNNRDVAWLLFEPAVLVDIALANVSMWKYEFSTVDWKGRNVCVPVMRVEAHLPPLK